MPTWDLLLSPPSISSKRTHSYRMSAYTPHRRSLRLMIKNGDTIPSAYPLQLTPQQQHIKLSYQLREMKMAQPAHSAPRDNHLPYMKSFLNLMTDTPRKNCKLRVMKDMFYSLGGPSQCLLSHEKFRDTVIAKIKELDEELHTERENRYVRDFYFAAYYLIMTIQRITANKNIITFKQ